MAEIRFSDVVADTCAQDAIEFISTWFEPDDYVGISMQRAIKGSTHNNLYQPEIAKNIIQYLQEDESVLRDLVWDPSTQNEFNIYYNVCAINTPGASPSIFKRGGSKVIKKMPGVWSDIDVKDGGFSSHQEILDFIASLQVQPSILVNSGSGGVHAYWKFDHDTLEFDQYASEAWWAYLISQSGEHMIDKVQDVARILRLPGTIRFPKTIDEQPSQVSLIENSGVVYDQKQLRFFSENFYKDVKKKLAEKVKREDKLNIDIENVRLKDATLGSRIFKKAFLEEYITKNYTWDDILLPNGWKFNRTLLDGSREWTRPGEGASARSAVTDYEDSEVMSLLSSDSSTGLLDLKEIGVPLTKMRVLQRLEYNDNIADMVEGVYS